MAHFAKLNNDNEVLEVHVVSNDALDSSNEEQSGIEFLTQWSGGYSHWKQASYNGTIRKNYPAAGFQYDETRDAFIAPKPFNSWVLNEDTCNWESPVLMPVDEKMYTWNEEQLAWQEVERTGSAS